MFAFWAAYSFVRYTLGACEPSYVNWMSTPYVALTYALNCLTSSSLAV